MGLTPHAIWGVTNAKIKFGILSCCFLMRFSFKYLRWCFWCSLWCAPKRRCSFIISVFDYSKPRCYYSCSYAVMRDLDAIIHDRMLSCETLMLLFVSVCCYAKPRCYYSCPYAVMRNLDAIIRVRMRLCETSMLLFVSVCCYAKPRCYYSCPYAVMRNLDAIIRVCMLLCETSMLLFVFRIMFVLIRVFRELDRYGLARVIN